MVSPLVSQSWPSTLACPLVGGMRPSRILIRVDLPAPLAPTRPVTPGATVTVSPSSAVMFPGYTLVSIFVSMTALAWTAGPGGPGACPEDSGAWIDGMVLPCQRAVSRVITHESEVCQGAAVQLIATAYTCRMTPLAAGAVTVGMCAPPRTIRVWRGHP